MLPRRLTMLCKTNSTHERNTELFNIWLYMYQKFYRYKGSLLGTLYECRTVLYSDSVCRVCFTVFAQVMYGVDCGKNGICVDLFTVQVTCSQSSWKPSAVELTECPISRDRKCMHSHFLRAPRPHCETVFNQTLRRELSLNAAAVSRNMYRCCVTACCKHLCTQGRQGLVWCLPPLRWLKKSLYKLQYIGKWCLDSVFRIVYNTGRWIRSDQIYMYMYM